MWSGISQSYEEILIPTWRLTSHNQTVYLLFGTALNNRLYPDAKGVVDFANGSGGILVPEISNERPLELTYDPFHEQLVIGFFFWKKKGFVENGEVIFKNIM